MHLVILLLLSLLSVVSCFTFPGTQIDSNCGSISLTTYVNGTGIHLTNQGTSGLEIIDFYSPTFVCSIDSTGLFLDPSVSLFAETVEASSDHVTIKGATSFFMDGSTIAHIGYDWLYGTSLIIDAGSKLATDQITSSTDGNPVSIGNIQMTGNINLGGWSASNGYLGAADTFFLTINPDTWDWAMLGFLLHGLGTSYISVAANSNYSLPDLSGGSDEITVNDAPQVLTNKEVEFTTSGATPARLDRYQIDTPQNLNLGGPWGTRSVQFNATRLGNIVVLSLPTVQDTANATAYITSSNTLDAAFYPAHTDKTMSVMTLVGSGSASGYITITTEGYVLISADGSGAAFGSGYNAGFVSTDLTYIGAPV